MHTIKFKCSEDRSADCDFKEIMIRVIITFMDKIINSDDMI